MSKPLLLSFTLLLLLLFIIILATVNAQKEQVENSVEQDHLNPNKGFQALSPDDIKQLIDFDEPDTRLESRCAACQAAFRFFEKDLKELGDSFRSRPNEFRESHIIAKTESLCDRHNKNIGILMETSSKIAMPLKFVRRDEVNTTAGETLLRGGAVEILFSGICGDFLDKALDTVWEKFKKGKPFNFCTKDCKKWNKRITQIFADAKKKADKAEEKKKKSEKVEKKADL